jgi:RNA polymerase sigma factor (sigma-70 family)
MSPLKEMAQKEKLTKEEEQALLEDGSEESLNKVLEHHLPYIIGIVHKRCRKMQQHADDIVHIGYTYAKNNMHRYNPDKSTLRTHIGWMVRAAMHEYISVNLKVVRIPLGQGRKSRQDELQVVPLNHKPDTHSCTLQDQLLDESQSPSAACALSDTLETIALVFAELDEREQYIVRETIIESRPMTDIGKEFGFSREYARQIRAKALQKMRRRLEELGCEGAYKILEHRVPDILDNVLN